MYYLFVFEGTRKLDCFLRIHWRVRNHRSCRCVQRFRRGPLQYKSGSDWCEVKISFKILLWLLSGQLYLSDKEFLLNLMNLCWVFIGFGVSISGEHLLPMNWTFCVAVPEAVSNRPGDSVFKYSNETNEWLHTQTMQNIWPPAMDSQGGHKKLMYCLCFTYKLISAHV